MSKLNHAYTTMMLCRPLLYALVAQHKQNAQGKTQAAE